MRVEIVDVLAVRFEHPEKSVILNSTSVVSLLETFLVPEGFAGLYLRDGKYVETLAAGSHTYWRNVAQVKVQNIDLREQVLDVSGQELMSSDKVTLRINALVTYRVADPLKATNVADDVKQALYREVQLALRAVVGTRSVDVLLEDKDNVSQELDTLVRRRADDFGLAIETVGIRDVILPGDMRDLLNKVTEAKKAAEANLITRREETAAMRSQANTAKLMENNPTLMRLRELETLEKVADKANLQVVLGEKGLMDRVINSI
jgi:regulator of protease activity HflC (stomatin/prohibitin superfamily)